MSITITFDPWSDFITSRNDGMTDKTYAGRANVLFKDGKIKYTSNFKQYLKFLCRTEHLPGFVRPVGVQQLDLENWKI